jgi:hypothetical protein
MAASRTRSLGDQVLKEINIAFDTRSMSGMPLPKDTTPERVHGIDIRSLDMAVDGFGALIRIGECPQCKGETESDQNTIASDQATGYRYCTKCGLVVQDTVILSGNLEIEGKEPLYFYKEDGTRKSPKIIGFIENGERLADGQSDW